MITFPEFLILRKPRSGCLEERTVLIQPIVNSFTAARPAGGVAGSAAGEPPAPVPHPLFLLFYLVKIRRRQLLQ